MHEQQHPAAEAGRISGTAELRLPGVPRPIESLSEFERLLSTPDWEVYAWLIGQKTVPGNYESDLLSRLMAYRYEAHAG